MKNDVNVSTTNGPNPHPDPYVFGPPGSAVSQRYGYEDPHPDPYPNITDPNSARKE